jgi:heme/copper-type cytochrome/quinol oxidase subunit 3
VSSGGAAAVPSARRRSAFPAGWWGMAVFVATEATLFGTLVGTYFYLRFRAPAWPPPGIPQPEIAVPLILAGVLVASTVLFRPASKAAARGSAEAAWLWIALALFVQAGYFAMQMRLFQDDLAKFTPQTGAYGSIYYTLLGAHHFHVAIGLLLDVWLLLKLARGLTPYRRVAVQAIAFYWYFVGVTALVVVGTQLSAAA